MREAQGVPVATLLDTKGPEIRTGDFEDPDGVVIHKGDTFTLTTKKCLGDAKHCYVNYPGLVEDVKVGTSILINDGLIAMEVTELRRDEIGLPGNGRWPAHQQKGRECAGHQPEYALPVSGRYAGSGIRRVS